MTKRDVCWVGSGAEGLEGCRVTEGLEATTEGVVCAGLDAAVAAEARERGLWVATPGVGRVLCGVARPDGPMWLRRGPWLAGAEGEFEWWHPLDAAREGFGLRRVELGEVAVPSGELVATSLIMDFEASGSGFVSVPAGTYRAVATLAEALPARDVAELAYLSLIPEGAGEEVRLSALERGDADDDGEVFFVDKYVLALADREDVRAAFVEAPLGAWLDGLIPLSPPAGEWAVCPLPGRERPVYALRAPQGIAAAVAGWDREGRLAAVHLVFFSVGTTGEDGEYDSE